MILCTLILGLAVCLMANLPPSPALATTCITVTPADDLAAIVAAAGDDTVLTLTAGTFHLTAHPPYDQGVWIQDKTGLTITGQGWRKTRIKLASDLALGFYVGSNVHRLTIEKLHLEGTLPLATNTHAIGNYTSTTGVTDVRFQDLLVSDVAVGINIGTSPSGVYDRVEITRNMILDTVGTDSGWGYGIACANSSHVAITRNFIRNATRHGIYFGRSAVGAGNSITNNVVYDHDYHRVQPLRVASALVCARGSSVTIAHNVVVNPRTYGLSVEADDTLGWPAVDITLLNNQVLGAYDAGIWIDTGESHTALGNRVVLQPDNPYWELELTRDSRLVSPDPRWPATGGLETPVADLDGLVYVLANGVLDQIRPEDWEYTAAPFDWRGATAMTAVPAAAGAPGGRLVVGQGGSLFAVDPADWSRQRTSARGGHFIMISTLPASGFWVADGATEHRLDVYADTTPLPGKAFFLAEWDLMIPDFLTLTRAELPAEGASGAKPPDFFHPLGMRAACCDHLDATAADGEADDNMRMTEDVFEGVENRVGLLGSYFFTVKPGTPPGIGRCGLNQVVFAATDLAVYTEGSGVGITNLPFQVVATPEDIPPPAPAVTARTPTRNPTPTWTWRGPDGHDGLFRRRLDNGPWTRTTAFRFTPATPLADGPHLLAVAAHVPGCGWSQPGLQAVQVDTAPPQPPVVTAASPTPDRTPTWTWVAGGGGNGSFRLRLDHGVWTGTTATSFAPAASLSPGSHILEVQERDTAGNWSGAAVKAVTITPINRASAVRVGQVSKKGGTE
ncbi:MAG: right-handed parallel beta-helix repeat-containing protein [Thermodesulfobacteriota bacterium]